MEEVARKRSDFAHFLAPLRTFADVRLRRDHVPAMLLGDGRSPQAFLPSPRFKRASVVAVHPAPLLMTVASKEKQLGFCKKVECKTLRRI